MSIYKEQIEERNAQDDAMFDAAYKEAESAIHGRRFSLDTQYPETAMGQVFKYLGVGMPSISAEFETDEDKFEAALSTSGVVKRKVVLEPNWYKDNVGVMLGFINDTSEPVALIPTGIAGYKYYDNESKKKIRINSKNENLFANEAYCFYKPLPAKELTTIDLLRFGLETWTPYEIVCSLVMLVLSTAIGLLIPNISYMLFSDEYIVGGTLSIIAITYYGVCLVVASNLLKIMHYLITIRSGTKLSVAIKSAVTMRMFSMPQSFYEEYNSGDISKRAFYLQYFCETIMDQVVLVALSCVFSLTYIIQMNNFVPELKWVSISVIVLNILFTLISSKYQVKISKEKLALTAKSNGTAFDILYGIQKIKLAGAQKRFLAKFSSVFAPSIRATYNPPTIIWMSKGISLAILLFGEVTMYVIASKLGIDSASFFSFLTAFAMITAGLTTLNQVVLQGSLSYGTLLMSEPILKTVPETNGQRKVLDHLDGNVELNHVSFRYEKDEPYVINNLSMKIKNGEYLAIVGKSGCGKSTLVKLLLGLETPERGTICYNGIDFEELDKTTVRSKIGAVLQEDQLFVGSIYDNLSICCPGAPEEDIWEAAKLAGIDEYIKSLPMGMHTFVTDDGGGFSGGQKQRMIIARAIAPKPSILLFDEATSALDNITQKLVNDSLDNLKCTRIVIAHRLSTIQNCDRICYIEDGKIVEEGTFNELLEKNGKFAELVERQRLKD